MTSFTNDLKRIARARKLDLEKISVTVPLRVFNATLRGTRVDTGRLRGNWQVTQNSPASGTVERLDKNEGGPLLASEAAKVQAFSVTYLTNNLDYAVKWEEVDGMAGLAIADFQRLVREEAEKL